MDKATLNLEIAKGTNFGPVLIYCKDSEGAAVPLAGWSAFAEVRKDERGSVILDLSPSIESNDAAGLVTIPEIPWETTDTMPTIFAQWDLILEDTSGKRLSPLIGGRFSINAPITQP